MEREAGQASAFSRHIGERIRYFRETKGISLSELSRRSGIAKGTLSRLEAGSGNPTIMTLGALALILDVTPGDFIDVTGGSTSLVATPRNLPGPVIQMLFVHRVVSTNIMDVYDATVPSLPEPFISNTHGGIEHLIMIDGEAEVGPVGSTVRLRSGQHVSFSGREPHLYWSPERPSRMFLIMEYPRGGEDAPKGIYGSRR
ncbi:MAG TPA: XRE family transcriptional regulator [Sphingomicrobium sp.]|nr:XRE family transcriptional regulator [Sphingomicrobium sp.]